MPTSKYQGCVERLADGIQNLTSSDDWMRYLEVQSRFHHYSFANALLIGIQHNDATQVAGFRTWQKLGRCVKKGEKAISILAPMICQKKETEQDPVLRGFRVVSVFDVSQTLGDPLPSPCKRLLGEAPKDSFAKLIGVAQDLGFRVEDCQMGGSTNGDCCHQLRRIRVNTSITPAQRVKTLAHEIAHAMIHETFADRSLAELEAESIAFIVCSQLGIASDDYSFGYVASWAGGSDLALAGVKASCQVIQSAAQGIIKGIEGHTSCHREDDNAGVESKTDSSLLVLTRSKGDWVVVS